MALGSCWLSSWSLLLAVLALKCSALEFEEDPIAVLEKLVHDHKFNKPKTTDAVASNSDSHYTRETFIYETHSDEIDPSSLPVIKNEPNNQKPARIGINRGSSNERKTIVISGRLKDYKKPSAEPKDATTTKIQDTRLANRGRKKTCEKCVDRNDWTPLDRQANYEPEEVGGLKDASAAKIETKRGWGDKSVIKEETLVIGEKFLDGHEKRSNIMNKRVLVNKPNIQTKTSEYKKKLPDRRKYQEATRISTSFNGRRRFSIQQDNPLRLDIKLELKDIGRKPRKEARRVPRKDQSRITKERRSDNTFGFGGFASSEFGSFNEFGIDFDVPKTTFSDSHSVHPKREISHHKSKPKTHFNTYSPPKDPSALYVEDPWKNIDKITSSSPPYIPKPSFSSGYEPELFDSGPDYNPYKPEPSYEPESAYKPEPIYKPEPVYKPEHNNMPESAYEEEPVYKPEPFNGGYYEPEPAYKPEPVYKPKPAYLYKKPNYRPPIQSKPTIYKPHAIIKVPYQEPEPHHEESSFHSSIQHHQPETYHSPKPDIKHKRHPRPKPYQKPQHIKPYHEPKPYHNIDPEPYHEPFTHFDHDKYSEPEDYIKPIKHLESRPFHYQNKPIFAAEPVHNKKKHHFQLPNFDGSPSNSNIHHPTADIHTEHFGPESFSPFDSHLHSTTSSDRDGARFLRLPGGAPGSKYSGDEVEFGAETGGYGAFRWFSDHPVKLRSSSRYHGW